MPKRLRAFRLRFAALLHHRRQQKEYAEELAFHQHMLRERLEREGTPSLQLDSATRRAFGNPSRLREQLSELRQFSQFENIFRDLGYAARVLRKSPGFTLTAILTIALGIGASTAIFSLINSLLLRPLPVPDAHQLVVFDYHEDNDGHGSLCAPLFRHLEHDHPAFTDVFAISNTQLQIGAAGGSAMVDSALISGQYFRALQTPPLLGRYLIPADDQPGAPSGLPAVISESYWHDVLHSDPHAVGSKVLANKIPFTIVGVMPKRFIGTDPTQHSQIFIPLATEPLIDAPYNNTAGGYHSWWLTTMGRRKPGVTLEQANASLVSVTRSVLSGKDDDAEGAADWVKDARAQHFRYIAESGSSGYTYLRQLYRQPLQAVFALCCGMLLLACLNLASLLFARAATRQHELATRLAVGASRRRLMQQLLIESLLLAIAGSLAGLVGAPFIAQSLAVLLLGGRDPSVYLDTSLDWRVLAAAAGACVLATFIIGMAPALHATGRSLNLQLKASASRTDLRTALLPRLLLSAQIALALVLIIGAGLISTSLVRMYRTGPGFDPHSINLVSVRMTKQPLEGAALIRRYHSLIDKFQALPGVRKASLVEIIPFTASYAESDYNRPGQPAVHLYENLIGPEYFETMRIPLLAGRDFSWSDAAALEAADAPNKSDAAKALPGKIVLSRSAAERFFPHENPLGRILESENHQSYEVIGVVGDTKYGDIREPAPPEGYTSITQNNDKKPSYTFVVRSEGPAASFASAVHDILARDVPEIPAPVFDTLSQTLDQSLSAQCMMAMLSVFFAACALLVTAIGLYGTLAYRTARRTSEIGIRMALGAQRAQVVSLVFRQNVAVTIIGALAGLAAALLAARALSSFLYGTSTHDPLVLALSTLLLAIVASAASLLPAIRAARINPLSAIRTE